MNLRKLLLGKSGKRLPIDEPPLRTPAQGVWEQFDDALANLSFCIAVPVILLVFLVFDWIRTSLGKPFIWWTMYALVSLAIWLLFSVIPLFLARRYRGRLRDLNMGAMAETIVGQTLESAREDLVYVFHDIVVNKGKRTWNIDHVAIGPSGIFVVETKGRSKPEKGNVEIRYDRKQLVFSDGGCDDAPLRQCEANAGYVRDLLTGLLAEKRNAVCRFDGRRPLPIVPVLVYPGWFIDLSSVRKAPIQITNHKLIRGVVALNGKKPALSKEEANELGQLLLNYFRNERKRLVEL